MDRVHSRWGKLVTVKRHLLILLFLTVLIRGVMFVSYPLGGQDEGQGFYRYNIAQFLAGDWQIGNLRYGPGYTLLIAPISAIGDLFGRFDERIELLFQVVLSSTIPFLLYDILRTRHSPRAAFIVAILSLADPFGLQWAHFSLPVWLVALCLVFSLWLLHHAERRRSWRLVVAAGLVTGFGVLGRWNYAPVVLGLGCLLLFIRQRGWRLRLQQFMIFGLSAVLVVILVHVSVQVPATGVWNFSCISGINMLELLNAYNIVISAENGPASEQFLRLGNLPALEGDETGQNWGMWFNTMFHYWQTPGSWAGDAQRESFIQQSVNLESASFKNAQQLSSLLYYYLGPCETDRLQRAVFFETIRVNFTGWLLGIPSNIISYLDAPISTDLTFPPALFFPPPHSIDFSNEGGVLGFSRAIEPQYLHYTGQWVWRPGIEIFNALWAPINSLRYLLIPALVWSLFTRRRIYRAMAFLLMSYVIMLSTFDSPEPRIYAIVYPLGPVLVGGFLLAVWERWWPALQRNIAARRR